MTDNKFVEEDFERLFDLDTMYSHEKQMETWEEYDEWVKEQERLPAIIEIVEINVEKETEK